MVSSLQLLTIVDCRFKTGFQISFISLVEVFSTTKSSASGDACLNSNLIVEFVTTGFPLKNTL
jgi:hypothetical protein